MYSVIGNPVDFVTALAMSAIDSVASRDVAVVSLDEGTVIAWCVGYP